MTNIFPPNASDDNVARPKSGQQHREGCRLHASLRHALGFTMDRDYRTTRTCDATERVVNFDHEVSRFRVIEHAGNQGKVAKWCHVGFSFDTCEILLVTSLNHATRSRAVRVLPRRFALGHVS